MTTRQIQIEHIDDLREEIIQSEVILVGELHGVKQNVEVLKKIAELIIKSELNVVLAFEWPLQPSEVAMINAYISGDSSEFPHSNFFLDSDERFSVEHVQLFKYLRRTTKSGSVSIVCFDSDQFSENFEQSMARMLLETTQARDEVIVAETGVVHARKVNAGSGSEFLNPMGFYVARERKTMSLFLRYISGTVTVEGVTYSVTDASSQIEGSGNMHDVEIVIKSAEPATSIKKLTEIPLLLE